MTDQLSRVFAALADPIRRDLVCRLAVGDATVGELAAPYEVTLQAVSKHLRVLEGAGLVTKGREAQRRPVHLEAEMFDLMTAWIERYRGQAEERYSRLDALLAEGVIGAENISETATIDTHDSPGLTIATTETVSSPAANTTTNLRSTRGASS